VELNLSAEAPGTLRVDNLHYQPSDGRFSATLIAAAGTPFAQRLAVGGRVLKTAEIPVLNRRLGTTEVISARDISWIDVRADALTGDVATSADQLIGRAPRRGLGENAPIRVRDVHAPVVVKRGDLVTMTLKTPVMTLTAQGRALADGSAGESVRVLNTGSSRTVEATVTGPNQVTVATAGAAALSR
jgi:flagella basal body P-ring formation protein FlgA